MKGDDEPSKGAGILMLYWKTNIDQEVEDMRRSISAFLILALLLTLGISIGITPTKVSAAQTYSTDFSNGATGWTTYGGTWAVENGEYSDTSGAFDKSVIAVTAQTNFVVEGDINVQNSGQGSLIFSVSNPTTGSDSFTGYSAGIDTNGTVWLGKHNNNWTSIASANTAIKAGTWYHIKIVRYNSQIKVFLNGNLMIDVNDSSYITSSMVGVRGGYNNHVHFDNITVSTVSSYSFNFDGGNANGWTPYGGTWAVTNGQYTVNSGLGYKSIVSANTYSSFVYEADVSCSSSGDAGLIFRVSSPAVGTNSYNGYYAGINSASGLVVLGKAANNWTEIVSVPYTITPNTLYHLKVSAEGKFIEVYINGTHVISAVDSTYTSGTIGVRAINSTAKFDNVQVIDNGTVTNPVYNWAWVKGAVFVPTNAVNQAQQWDQYDPEINDRELRNISVYGINCVRVYLHYAIYLKNKTALLNNIEDFLTRANKYGLKTEFVFFDDCWTQPPDDLTSPSYVYPAPVYGVHNSRWLQCPGTAVKNNYASHKANLKAYVQDVVNAHKNDSRIAFWEVYNEPGNSGNGAGTFGGHMSQVIMNDARMWIRETGTGIPMTSTGPSFLGDSFSDFHSWHVYTVYAGADGGPSTLNTECMQRQNQSVPGVVSYFSGKTGYVLWEAGIGRDNCRFPWANDASHPATAEPTTPFHGLLYPDGHPWALTDVQAIKGNDLSTAPVFNVNYYSDNNFTTLKKTSIVPAIDFDLDNETGTGSPDASAGIGIDNFSIRYTGKVVPASTGTFTFYADSDNIARVWIGGTQIINKTTSGRSEASGTISLTAGTAYTLTVEYAHAAGNASMHVRWSGPNLSKTILLGNR